MATKNITIRVSEETAEFLSKVYNNTTAGATMCVEIVEQMIRQSGSDPHTLVSSMQFLQQIRAYSTREISGKFTADEWKYLADALNGTMITPEFRCHVGGLIAEIEDTNDFDGLGAKWNVDVVSFIEKVKQLTGAQVDAIYTHVEKFWNNPEADALRDLNKWSEQLS